MSYSARQVPVFKRCAAPDCGQKFKIIRQRPARLYCDMACKRRARAPIEAARIARRNTWQGKIIVCREAECSNTFEMKAENHLYCSDTCRNRLRYRLKQRCRNRDPDYIAPHRMLEHARARARKNNLACNITLSDIVIPKLCPVLGIPLIRGTKHLHANSPSLDKVFPELGYVKGNVAVISMRANALKSNGTIEEFQNILAYMHRHEGAADQAATTH